MTLCCVTRVPNDDTVGITYGVTVEIAPWTNDPAASRTSDDFWLWDRDGGLRGGNDHLTRVTGLRFTGGATTATGTARLFCQGWEVRGDGGILPDGTSADGHSGEGANTFLGLGDDPAEVGVAYEGRTVSNELAVRCVPNVGPLQ